MPRQASGLIRGSSTRKDCYTGFIHSARVGNTVKVCRGAIQSQVLLARGRKQPLVKNTLMPKHMPPSREASHTAVQLLCSAVYCRHSSPATPVPLPGVYVALEVATARGPQAMSPAR